jgi:hypothetical protein
MAREDGVDVGALADLGTPCCIHDSAGRLPAGRFAAGLRPAA